MSLIKTTLASVLLLISGSSLAANSGQQALEKALKPWQPVEILKSDNTLTVALPGSSMTTEAYESVIMSGICPLAWSKGASKSALKGLQEVNVTNQYKALGYTLENPLSTCTEIGKLMDKPAKVMLMGNTHMFTGKAK
ncbi:hypothetical protein C3O70_20230 [Cronobacter sakazakii]|uniref:hypothetical protein n=1 Tax=Cronobacter sakazakii TaxID=28141 RepID=UPI000F5C4C94|nr:hypothetical protein [Cronobacter sakazakii]RRA29566.1 hypothetical protein C3O71_03675 [Cronobacter sakazakii]RRA30002.1 hypothetical protein C3O70_20230 [Cronobacter sakazakii]